MSYLRILFLGDIVGTTGRIMFQKYIQSIRKEYHIDAVIVNGENSSSNGRGITSRIVHFFKQNGVDIITSGNHIWHKKEIYAYLDQNRDLLRPANFPPGAPGVGVTTFACGNYTIGVINLQGRVFMREHLDCPFRTAESLLTYLQPQTKLIFIDFHAEATSEKTGLSYYLDGRVSGIVGTHTHIQTSDERILPGGTGYITDLGMTGSLNSMLGMRKEPIIRSFMTQMPSKFEVDTELPVVLCGAWIEVDVQTGKATKIERIQIIDRELAITQEHE